MRGRTSPLRIFKRPYREDDLVTRPAASQAALVSALDELAAAISVSRNVQEVLLTIVDAAKRFTRTDKVVICLMDEFSPYPVLDPSTLVVRGRRDQHDEDWWGDRLIAMVDRVFDDTHPSIDIDDERGAWMLSVPIRVHDRPLGVLLAINDVKNHLREEHTAYLSVLGTLAAVAIANARLADEGRYAMLASERERIARQMHDGVMQSLFSISLGLAVARKQVFRDPPKAAERLGELEQMLGAGMAELRRYIYDLRPVKLQEYGLHGAIEYWLKEMVPPGGPRTHIEVEGTIRPMTADVEACLYRVAREAVANAVKHAGATDITVRLEYGPSALTLTVIDDGHGFDVSSAMEKSESGITIGLRSLHERVRTAGGGLAIDSAPGGGCRLCARVPC
jgi:signal transduction histidine kinase